MGGLALVLGLGLVASACTSKPKPGETCDSKTASCLDGQSRLACIDGHLQALACQGPSGCRESGGVASCDTSRATETEVCDQENAAACTIDGTLMLTCSKGRWHADQKCRGARGCNLKPNPAKTAEQIVSCDQSIATAGDRCGDDKPAAACTQDKHTRLRCKDHAFSTETACRGAKGCEAKTTNDQTVVDCDINKPEEPQEPRVGRKPSKPSKPSKKAR